MDTELSFEGRKEGENDRGPPKRRRMATRNKMVVVVVVTAA